jgi:SurA-like N-terminal domain
LALFGGLFVLLFAGVALAVGVSSEPGVPPGDVAIIEGAPPRLAQITRAEFEQDMRQQAALSGLGEDFGPGDPGYTEVKKQSLSLLISAVWMESEAIRRGVPVTSQQIASRLRPEEASLQKAHFTQKTMEERVSWMLAGDNILAKLDEETPRPTEAEVRAYYRENPSDESFAEAKKAIANLIDERRQAEVFNNIEMDWRGEWQLRTRCADGFVVEECANYPIFDHNSSDPSACFEPNPKTPAEECEAAVTQPRTAQPGSVRWWHPEGERLVQRPVPPGGGEAEAFGG